MSTSAPQYPNGIKPGIIAERIKQETLRVIEKDEAVVRRLLPEEAPERNKYPESEFRRHFLPVFSGEAYDRLPPDYTPERLTDEAYRFWTQVSGGAIYEVEVVEEDGSTAFIVPALVDTSILSIAQARNRPGMRQLQEDVVSKAQGLPHIANAHLASGLERKLVEMTAGNRLGDRKISAERIQKIRDYYGLEAPAESKGKSAGDSNFMGDMSFD